MTKSKINATIWRDDLRNLTNMSNKLIYEFDKKNNMLKKTINDNANIQKTIEKNTRY